MSKTPFALPVRLADTKHLVAADCELICCLEDATPAERAFIVKAINAYPMLGELRDCCELNLDDLEPETVALLDRVDEALK